MTIKADTLMYILFAFFWIGVALVIIGLSQKKKTTVDDSETQKKKKEEEEAQAKLQREARKREDTLSETARLLSRTDPHSDEERRLIALVEEFDLSYREWKHFIGLIDYHSPGESIRLTRPYIYYRLVTAFEREQKMQPAQ